MTSFNLQQKKKGVVLISLLVCVYWGLHWSGKNVPAERATKLTSTTTTPIATTDVPAALEKLAVEQHEDASMETNKEMEASTEAEVDAAPQTIELEVDFEGTVSMIKILMDPEAAPNTVKNFVDLTKVGFFTGSTFYRAEPGFVIQGGGRTKEGRHKPQPFQRINLEAKKRNLRGTISMARTVWINEKLFTLGLISSLWTITQLL